MGPLGADDDDRNREDRRHAPCQPDQSDDPAADEPHAFLELADDEADQAREQRPRHDGAEARPRQAQTGGDGYRMASQGVENLAVEGHVDEGGEERRHEVEHGRQGVTCGREAQVLAVGAPDGPLLCDGLPVRLLRQPMAGRPQHGGGEKEYRHHDHQQRKNDREQQQHLVLENDPKGALHQRPASLELAHFPPPFVRCSLSLYPITCHPRPPG